MEELTIDRARWLRGEGSTPSYLLRKGDGKMCCLGFYCLSRGLTAEQIKGNKTPAEVDNATSLVPLVEACQLIDDPHVHASKACSEMMRVNDSVDMEDRQREEELTRLFGELGVSVKFIN